MSRRVRIAVVGLLSAIVVATGIATATTATAATSEVKDCYDTWPRVYYHDVVNPDDGNKVVGRVDLYANKPTQQVCMVVVRIGPAAAISDYTSARLESSNGTVATNAIGTRLNTQPIAVTSPGCVKFSTRITYGPKTVVWGQDNLLCSYKEAAVKVALAQLGKPYVWGATGPRSFDCSGLVVYSFSQVGHPLRGRSTWDLRDSLPKVSKPEIGDVVFYNNIEHMAIYIGNNQIVAAPHTGDVVRIQPLTYPGRIDGYGRT